MKKSNYLFWATMMLIAIFYIFKGNDMHKEKYQMIQDKRKDSTQKMED